MPIAYVPVKNLFNAYIPRFILISVLAILFLPVFIFNIREFVFSCLKETEIKFLLAYVALLIISVFFASDKLSALIGYLRFDGVTVILIYIIIFFVSGKIRYIHRNALHAVLAIACLVSIHAILQKYYLDPIPAFMYPSARTGAASSTMGNPNFMGSYTALLLPFGFYLYVEKNEKFGVITYGIMFYALLCTRTRGAWIGAFIAIMSFLVLKHKVARYTPVQVRNVIKVTVMSLGLIVIMSLTDNNELFSRFISIFLDFGKLVKNSPDAYFGGSGRIVIWGRVIEIIKTSPLIGIGIENLGQVMDSLYREFMYNSFGRYQIYDMAHNEYLHIAVTSGVPSLAMYLLFFYYSLKKSIIKVYESNFYLPIGAALIGFLAFSVFNNSLILFEYLVWIFLGIASSSNVAEYVPIDSHAHTLF